MSRKTLRRIGLSVRLINLFFLIKNPRVFVAVRRVAGKLLLYALMCSLALMNDFIASEFTHTTLTSQELAHLGHPSVI